MKDSDGSLLFMGRTATACVADVARIPGRHMNNALLAAARARVSARRREREALASAVRARNGRTSTRRGATTAAS